MRDEPQSEGIDITTMDDVSKGVKRTLFILPNGSTVERTECAAYIPCSSGGYEVVTYDPPIPYREPERTPAGPEKEGKE